MLTDSEVETIVAALEKDAIGYSGDGSDIQGNRALILDRYNMRPYGDEIEGQSSVVTSDVYDVVEGMLPGLMRMFTQGREIVRFNPTRQEAEEEAREKTQYANWVFQVQHNPVMLLMSYCKDALLQYTGTLKTYWDDTEEFVDGDDFIGLTVLEVQKLQSDKNYKISQVIQRQDETGAIVFDVDGIRTNKTGKIIIEPVPPNEMLISKSARDFDKPKFYGHITPKTRSELLQMGFDKKIVSDLGRDEDSEDSVKSARNYNLNGPVDVNPTEDRSQDVFKLGEYYLFLDKDEDGISEYYQVFFISGERKLLEMTKVDNNPLATSSPIPMPHRAIGECPASRVLDHQYWKSTLVRQLNNNIYSGNFTRLLVNERVDGDDLLTPTPGGVVMVDGEAPVSGSIEPIPTIPQTDGILRAIEYADVTQEVRTGVTRYNQGLDTEGLNKTATAFSGISDMSQMKTELIARVLSQGLKKVFKRIIELASKFQDKKIDIMVSGDQVQIDPKNWRYTTDCTIEVGVGGGDRRERISNLNYIYEQQKLLKELGSPLVDDVKMYNTLDKLTQQIGLHGASHYFNSVERPIEMVQAENEALRQAVQQLQAQTQNPLAEAEQVKGQTQVQLKQIDSQVKLEQERMKQEGRLEQERMRLDGRMDETAIKTQVQAEDIAQKNRHHAQDVAVELTKIEANSGRDVEGSLI